ncbi:uncharacterized protein LOC118323047 [Morone saxatilis]|uniref:uncharacterized protein LOC118323047 n=1 Tax=Morone saxatilis TaxID=34816 RepID=UPI0015E216D0|nr:uncharacterized protein LOC118323047 [Morone saxatilis]
MHEAARVCFVYRREQLITLRSAVVFPRDRHEIPPEILRKTRRGCRAGKQRREKKRRFRPVLPSVIMGNCYCCRHLLGAEVTRGYSFVITCSISSHYPGVSLPKPSISISMNPAGEVTWGQDVGITCSISTQHLGGTFILQKTSGSFRKTQTSSTNSVTFSILKVNFDNEGSYQCQYQTQVLRRDFSSPSSESVRLFVSVRLPKPSISMNPAGEVTWGQDVGITCSISTQHLGGTFILQKTSGSFRKTQTSSTNSATFSILKANFDNMGSYKCQYQLQVSSGDLSSPLSDAVRLSFTVPLLLLVSSVVAGILLGVLLVLVVVFLRRRQQARQPATIVLTQLSVRNHYEDLEEEEEERDANFEAVHSEKRQEETRSME